MIGDKPIPSASKSRKTISTLIAWPTASRRFANDQCGRKAFVKWFAQTPVQRAFEPTGPYHRAFERALGTAGVPFVKVNPRQACRFAEAIGNPAKTDCLDAAMLARMGAMLELKTRPPRSEALLELRELTSLAMPREYLALDLLLGQAISKARNSR